MDEVLELLQADPRIAAAALLPSFDGTNPSVVVRPADAWLATQAGDPGPAMRRSLRGWETTYDLVYSKPASKPAHNTDAARFAGWISSFTGEPIPVADMLDWLDAITSRLLALPHQRIHDIGCGSGLLVDAIAPHCSRYVARDLSAAAIQNLQQRLCNRPELAHVHAVHGDADGDCTGDDEFDLVIINSVCQYFPDAAYLERVLEAAWHSLAPGGHIVVGDVRPASLQPVLLSAVALHRATDDSPVGLLRQAIHAAWLGQAELLVDPDFFDGFAAGHGGTARILLKAGAGRSEMTRFRFDAIIGKPNPAKDQAAAHTTPDRLSDVSALRHWLGSGAHGIACLPGCANARLSTDLQAYGLLQTLPDAGTVAALREMIGRELPQAIDPAELEGLAAAAGCRCEITPVRGDDTGRFDAWFGPAGSSPFLPLQPSQAVAGSSAGLGRFASRPLLMLALRRLAASLQSELASRLPASLMPARILPALSLNQPMRAWTSE